MIDSPPSAVRCQKPSQGRRQFFSPASGIMPTAVLVEPNYCLRCLESCHQSPDRIQLASALEQVCGRVANVRRNFLVADANPVFAARGPFYRGCQPLFVPPRRRRLTECAREDVGITQDRECCRQATKAEPPKVVLERALVALDPGYDIGNQERRIVLVAGEVAVPGSGVPRRDVAVQRWCQPAVTLQVLSNRGRLDPFNVKLSVQKEAAPRSASGDRWVQPNLPRAACAGASHLQGNQRRSQRRRNVTHGHIAADEIGAAKPQREVTCPIAY